MKTVPDVVERLAALFAERGQLEYHGEAVTQLEHALQCGALAVQSGADDETVVAALLHDIGHLLHRHGEDAAERGIDDRHEALGDRYLARFFGPGVCEPVKHHVAAKRYLCATDPMYRATLSSASETSLRLQGGPMSPGECAEFERHPHFQAMIDVRRWDDLAKVPGLAVPGFPSYVDRVRRVARGD
jgi:phosphonate degradation associated HDIG domain protein